MMLLLTESTLHWLNLIWNISATWNRRTVLRGRVTNWIDDVVPDSGNGTPQNSAASDHSTRYPPSSTIPSLTSKVTSASSAASDISAHDRNEVNGEDYCTTLPNWIRGPQTKVSID